MKACIDTNIIYNILFRTDKTIKARKLLEEHISEDLYITTTIYNELFYTVTVKLLGRPGPRTLRRIIASKGYPEEVRKIEEFLEGYDIEMLIEKVDRRSIMKTAARYRILPSDAIIALTCKNNYIHRIISLDEDFDRIPWLKRIH